MEVAVYAGLVIGAIIIRDGLKKVAASIAAAHQPKEPK